MKKNYFVQFVMICAGLFIIGLQNLSAQVTFEKNADGTVYEGTQGEDKGYGKYYVLLDKVHKEEWGEKAYSYDYAAPGCRLFFEAYRGDGWGETGRVVEVYAGSTKLSGRFDLNTDDPTWYDYAITDRNNRNVSIKLGGTYDKHINCVYVAMASYFEFKGDASDYTKIINMTSQPYGNPDNTVAEVVIDFCNIGETITIEKSGNYDILTANITTNPTGLSGKWGTVTFIVTDTHKKTGSHSATYKLTAGGKTLTMIFNCETEKAETAIDWRDVSGMLVGDTVINLARARSRGDITYTLEESSSTDVLLVDNVTKTLTANKIGTVYVRATSAATDNYKSATDRKKITVDNKVLIKTYLNWDEDFVRLLENTLTTEHVGEKIPLSVVMTYDRELEEGEMPHQGELIYSLTDVNPAGCVTLSNGELTIHGAGTAQLTASILADGTFSSAATPTAINVRIQDADATCESKVVQNGSFDIKVGALENPIGYTYSLNGGKPKSFSFFFTGTKDSDLRLKQIVNGEEKDIVVEAVSKATKPCGPYDLDTNATAILFKLDWEPGGNSGAVSTLNVLRATYLEPQAKEVDFGTIDLGAGTREKKLVVDFSNLPRDVDILIESTNSRFSVFTPKYISSSCNTLSEYGTKDVIIHFSTDNLQDSELGKEFTDKLIFKDITNKVWAEVELKAKVDKVNQTIVWPLATTMNEPTIFTCVLPERATPNYNFVPGQKIQYTSSNEGVAYVDAERNLVILKDGEAIITANTISDEYDAAINPAPIVSSTLQIRRTNITVPNVILVPLMQDDALSSSIITPNGDVVTNEDSELYTNHVVAGTWSFVNPPQELNYGTHTLQVQFKADKDNFYTPDPSTPQEATLEVKPYDWLSAMPANGTVVAEKSAYRNFLFAENGNDYAELTTTKDITITEELNYMFFVTAADDWRTFVAPFNISNAYVIEMTPEVDDRYTMEANQPAAYAALYEQLVEVLATKPADKTAKTVVEEFIATQPNSSQLGIYDITSGYYYLYESADTWNIVEGRLEKQWTEINSSSMEQGKTYAIRFPWCELCQDRTPWDYWTGKLILLTGAGPQTISGSHVLESDIRVSPDVNTATFVGNHSFASMDVPEDVWVHDVVTDRYMSQGAIKVKPTASFLYANIPARQGKRAVAINRSGEIVWEDDPNAGDSGVVTGLQAAQDAYLRVMSQEGGFSVVSSAAQPIQVYSISGTLVYQSEMAAQEARFISAEAGVYVVRTATHAYKVIAR